jgi:hypothetical protein
MRTSKISKETARTAKALHSNSSSAKSPSIAQKAAAPVSRKIQGDTAGPSVVSTKFKSSSQPTGISNSLKRKRRSNTQDLRDAASPSTKCDSDTNTSPTSSYSHIAPDSHRDAGDSIVSLPPRVSNPVPDTVSSALLPSRWADNADSTVATSAVDGPYSGSGAQAILPEKPGKVSVVQRESEVFQGGHHMVSGQGDWEDDLAVHGVKNGDETINWVRRSSRRGQAAHASSEPEVTAPRRAVAVESAQLPPKEEDQKVAVTPSPRKQPARTPKKEAIKNIKREIEEVNGEVKIHAPENWKIMFDLTRAMRSGVTAPVDTMGCERLADEDETPKARESHHSHTL